MALIDAVRELVVERLQVKSEEVVLESNFMENLGADSLDSVELMMALEEKFKITVSDDDAGKLKTVQDVVNYLAAKGITG